MFVLERMKELIRAFQTYSHEGPVEREDQLKSIEGLANPKKQKIRRNLRMTSWRGQQ